MTAATQIAVIYCVHRQSRLVMMPAPMTGPSVGPPTTATAYRDTGVPRASRLKMSPRAALTLLTGPDPKMPLKSLVTNHITEKRPTAPTAAGEGNGLAILLHGEVVLVLPISDVPVGHYPFTFYTHRKMGRGKTYSAQF